MKGAFMHIFSRYEKRDVTFLDKLWDFVFLGEIEVEGYDFGEIEYDDRLPVPSAFDSYPSYAGKRGVSCYRIFIDVPAGKNAFLRFRGTGMWNRIMVDGAQLSEVALPYSQFEVMVPKSSQSRRELVVINDNRYNRDSTSLQMNHFDFYGYGGIFRSVELHILPDVWLDDVRIISADAKSGKADISFAVNNDGASGKELFLEVSADDKIVFSDTVKTQNGRCELSINVPEAREWSAEEPNLHIIHIKTAEDDYRERIGFRKISTENGVIGINGKTTKLFGYCRHEAHPQFGPALPVAQMVQDLQLMQDLGCNFIRGAHYPQDPDFLDLCDEMGFYIFEETLGWGNKQEQYEHPNFPGDQLKQTELMIKKSYNHPSVIMWGFLNEGRSKDEKAVPLYRDIAQTIRKNDKTRPITYASMFPFEDFCFDFVDIISVNTYPAWYNEDQEALRPLGDIDSRISSIQEHLEKTGQGGKPFIISEIGAGAIYGWRDPLNAPWTETYQAEYLEKVCQRFIGDSKISGVSIWQFCDCRTYATGYALVRPRAFNNKGSFDEYRRPKESVNIVRKLMRCDS